MRKVGIGRVEIGARGGTVWIGGRVGAGLGGSFRLPASRLLIPLFAQVGGGGVKGKLGEGWEAPLLPGPPITRQPCPRGKQAPSLSNPLLPSPFTLIASLAFWGRGQLSVLRGGLIAAGGRRALIAMGEGGGSALRPTNVRRQGVL